MAITISSNRLQDIFQGSPGGRNLRIKRPWASRTVISLPMRSHTKMLSGLHCSIDSIARYSPGPPPGRPAPRIKCPEESKKIICWPAPSAITSVPVERRVASVMVPISDAPFKSLACISKLASGEIRTCPLACALSTGAPGALVSRHAYNRKRDSILKQAMAKGLLACKLSAKSFHQVGRVSVDSDAVELWLRAALCPESLFRPS